MHYSRITSSPNKTYSAASAVLLNELLKGSISVLIALKNIDNDLSAPTHPLSEKDALKSQPVPPRRAAWSMLHPSRLNALRIAVFSPDCVKLSIPAILYVIQNNLQYVAASNLDVATFQVTYQMKILTTAAFSVVMLRKRLSTVKWLSLVLLAVGVGIVQIQSSTTGGGAKISLHAMNPLKGFMAVTAACMTSGLAGVYFELLLKGSGATQQPDLWVRNTQLSLFSLIPALLPILWGSAGDTMGPIGRLMAAFSNFNAWAVGTVLTQTFGGLITAVVIRYSDNIMKGFATSLSIIISFLASVALFNYPITVAFLAGSTIVLAATFMYNTPAQSTPASLQSLQNLGLKLNTSPKSRKDVATLPGSPISTSAPILGEPEKPSRASSVISLLGLAGSRPPSRAPSRAPSGENLRHMSSLSSINSNYSYSNVSAIGTGNGNGQPHVYAASAPGTPYLSSGSAGHGYMGAGNGNGSGNTSHGSHGSFLQPGFMLPPMSTGHSGNSNGNTNTNTNSNSPYHSVSANNLNVAFNANSFRPHPPRVTRKSSTESSSSDSEGSVLGMGAGMGLARSGLRVEVGAR
jgi:UDP-sugar transporter A1/2/3